MLLQRTERCPQVPRPLPFITSIASEEKIEEFPTFFVRPNNANSSATLLASSSSFVLIPTCSILKLCIAFTASLQICVISSHLQPSIRGFLTIHVPPMQRMFLRFAYSPTFSVVTPPVGMNVHCGNGPPKSSMILYPPLRSAGKSLRCVTPLLIQAVISDGFEIPGIVGTLFLIHQSTTSGLYPGETMNFAPAFTAFSACSTLRTVPAPTSMFGSALIIASIASAAQAVRKVTSLAGKPPFTRA